MVLDFIEARTLTQADIATPAMLARVVLLVRRCHREIPGYLRGPSLIFWPFHVIRDYGVQLVEQSSAYRAKLPELQQFCRDFESAAGPHDIVFGHNDLLAANILDDGNRLWLIDWDYAGFNSPLFDLGGLASNSKLNETQEIQMLELYFEAAPDAGLLHRYQAMKCASLLREVLWSMVSELTSDLDVDYAAYTALNPARFRRAHQEFLQT